MHFRDNVLVWSAATSTEPVKRSLKFKEAGEVAISLASRRWARPQHQHVASDRSEALEVSLLEYRVIYSTSAPPRPSATAAPRPNGIATHLPRPRELPCTFGLPVVIYRGWSLEQGADLGYAAAAASSRAAPL